MGSSEPVLLLRNAYPIILNKRIWYLLWHTYHSGGGWLQATSRTSDVLVQEKDSMLFWKVFRYIVDTTREENSEKYS